MTTSLLVHLWSQTPPFAPDNHWWLLTQWISVAYSRTSQTRILQHILKYLASFACQTVFESSHDALHYGSFHFYFWLGFLYVCLCVCVFMHLWVCISTHTPQPIYPFSVYQCWVFVLFCFELRCIKLQYTFVLWAYVFILNKYLRAKL
jgi:hypothetical protein